MSSLEFKWSYDSTQGQWYLHNSRISQGWIFGRVTEDGLSHYFISWGCSRDDGSIPLGRSSTLEEAKKKIENYHRR